MTQRELGQLCREYSERTRPAFPCAGCPYTVECDRFMKRYNVTPIMIKHLPDLDTEEEV